MRQVESAEELRRVYAAMVREDSLRLCFPFEPFSKGKFVHMMSSFNICFVCYYGGRLSGFVWLNRMEHKTCRINFCSFEPSRGIIIAGLRESLTRIWKHFPPGREGSPEVFLSYVLESNTMSAKAAEKCGFTYVGLIPDYYGIGVNVKVYSSSRKRSITR
ncbi:MAG: hypothetical protein JXR78_15245 [Victivallales bacterium]|nr:hypothetical protein [Victivallales bacterium]